MDEYNLMWYNCKIVKCNKINVFLLKTMHMREKGMTTQTLFKYFKSSRSLLKTL